MLPYRDESVLPPSLSTKLICEALGDCFEERTLVVGSGAGLLPIYCALHGAEVTAIDIERSAVQLTLRNSHELKADVKAEVKDFWVMCKDDRRYWDLIVSNPPQQPSTYIPWNASWFEYAHFGGFNGLEFICGLIRYSARRLTEQGRLVCSIFDFLYDDIWQRCAADCALDWHLCTSSTCAKGPVTSRQMLKYPQEYRTEALVLPTYQVRVFEFHHHRDRC